MRTAGVFLIFAAVALRGFVAFSGEPQFSILMGLLAGYGLLLSLETWITHRKAEDKRFLARKWWRPAYLLLQSALVLAVLAVSTFEDFLALLFIPLSLEAISFFGRRSGYPWIVVFSLFLIGALLFSDEGQVFGLAMGAFYSGLCFLFGGYANQVRRAEAAHTQNQRMFKELESAHRQLQGYADQVANLAVEQERNRLARDLHDSVTQTVFSMNLAAQSARLLLDKEPPRVPEQLLRLDELAASALGEIQSLVSKLRPRSVLEEGLPTALRRLADEHQVRDGLQVALEICGERPLADRVAEGLYSIAHEALVNVAKHSGSHEAVLRLNLSGSGSCLEIEDHGLGFDPQLVLDQPGHLGLAGMSERAREIGWRLSVESQRGRGTRICVAETQNEGVVLSVPAPVERSGPGSKDPV
jgi:signal transduction histidine kinase